MNELLDKWKKVKNEFENIGEEILKEISQKVIEDHPLTFEGKNPHYLEFSIDEKKDYYYISYFEFLDAEKEEIELDSELYSHVKKMFKREFGKYGIDVLYDLDFFIPILNNLGGCIELK